MENLNSDSERIDDKRFGVIYLPESKKWKVMRSFEGMQVPWYDKTALRKILARCRTFSCN